MISQNFFKPLIENLPPFFFECIEYLAAIGLI